MVTFLTLKLSETLKTLKLQNSDLMLHFSWWSNSFEMTNIYTLKDGDGGTNKTSEQAGENENSGQNKINLTNDDLLWAALKPI